jgi:hypothetical protein
VSVTLPARMPTRASIPINRASPIPSAFCSTAPAVAEPNSHTSALPPRRSALAPHAQPDAV